jgi:hypothetical protein
MNGEEQFEQWVRRRPQRQIPGSWRDEILTTAKAAARAQLAVRAPHGSRLVVIIEWLRNLVWPSPRAWAALGAAWVLVLALNLSSREPSRPGTAGRTVQATPEVREMLRQQEQLIAELMWRPTAAEARKPAVPQPRSQRREEMSMA